MATDRVRAGDAVAFTPIHHAPPSPAPVAPLAPSPAPDVPDVPDVPLPTSQESDRV